MSIRDKFPRNENCRVTFRNKELLLDDCVVVDLVTPARPRLVFEGFNTRCSVRMNYIGSVTLRRNSKCPARCFHPCIEAVYQHHPAGRRRRCREKQRVIAAAANSGDRATCESAEAVRLDPLGVRITWIHAVAGGVDAGWFSAWRDPGRPGSSPPATTKSIGFIARSGIDAEQQDDQRKCEHGYHISQPPV